MASTPPGSRLSDDNGATQYDESVDGTPESSYTRSDESDGDTAPCRWQNLQYFDQECSRFFDCPSHVVSRRVSEDFNDEHLSEQAYLQQQDEIHVHEDEMGGETAPVETTGVSPVRGTADDLEDIYEEDDHNTTEDATATSPLPEPHNTGESGEGPSVPRSTQHTSFPIRTSSAYRRRFGSPSTELDGSSTSLHITRHADEIPPWPRDALPVTSSGQRQDAIRRSSSHSTRTTRADSRSSDFTLPRWQPDAEVTYCPICHTQFSIFVRKHHCRKCGRVVCASCSPHRIIIPHQYIVRPPGFDMSIPPNTLADRRETRYVEANGLSGGERVRLCNPCVPDPNTAPPQSPTSPSALSPRSHQRSRSSLNSYGGASLPYRDGSHPTNTSRDAQRYYTSRSRSITMVSGLAAKKDAPMLTTMQGNGSHAAAGSSSRSRTNISSTYQSPLDRFLSVGPSSFSAASYGGHQLSIGGSSSSRYRALPPPPQIAEEDECPICHRELPSRTLDNFEMLRESHISSCIQNHSAYGSLGQRDDGEGQPAPVVPRRTGMYTYAATEKDCIDDAECTICLEEFTVGVAMARLECLCRFHRSCISAWFVNHPGRCPVHQHDGFGF